MRSQTLLFVFAFLCSLRLVAQDFQFVQFWNAPMQLNPALTGAMNQDNRFRLNSNQQLNRFFGSTLAQQISTDAKLPVFQKDYIGIGGEFLIKYRPIHSPFYLQNIQATLSASYIKGLGNSSKMHYLALGANVYYGKRDRYSMSSSLTTFLPYYHRLDVDLGLSWSFQPSKKAYYNAGFAVAHLNQSTHPFSIPEGYRGLYPGIRYTLHGTTYNEIARRWALGSQTMLSAQHRNHVIQCLPTLHYFINKKKEFSLQIGIGAAFYGFSPQLFYFNSATLV